MKINCHYRLGRQFQDPLEAMDGWKGQIVRTDDLHGASRPKGCAQGWAQ
ncbi:MAG: hypothetical protein OXS28_06060 [Gammaproteobacteria bacterium]|nr:hypothetical protein [Gammaproteobacteria bacterium]